MRGHTLAVFNVDLIWVSFYLIIIYGIISSILPTLFRTHTTDVRGVILILNS